MNAAALCTAVIIICAVLILVTHAVYPLLICVLAYFKSSRDNIHKSSADPNNKHSETAADDDAANTHSKSESKTDTEPLAEPSVLLIIPAYNEAAVIEKKISNSCALNYKNIKIRILCDGCTDETADIALQHPEVDLTIFAERRGKPAAINAAVEKSDADIIITTDANTELHPDSIQMLVRHFKNPYIGVVCGNIVLSSSERYSSMSSGELTYWRFETSIKHAESFFGMLAGISGALLAFRRDYYVPIPEDTILDDLMIALEIARQNYSVLFDPAALAFEKTPKSTQDEITRKTRLIAGGFQAASRFKELLNPFKHKFFFSLFFHKILRWCSPLFFWTALSCALYLGQTQVLWRNVCLAFAGVCLLIASEIFMHFFIQVFTGKKDIKIRYTALPFYFIIVNAAGLLGFIKWLTGTQHQKWNKADR